MEAKFDTAFASYFEGCKKVTADHFAVMKYKDDSVWSFSEGPKYVKVFNRGSVHSFVDKTNGNVLKPASWKAPAKHARGNIYAADNGLKNMGPYGPAYLR